MPRKVQMVIEMWSWVLAYVEVNKFTFYDRRAYKFRCCLVAFPMTEA